MKFELDVDAIAKRAFVAAEQCVKSNAEEKARGLMSHLFQSPQGGHWPRPEGIGREIIRKKCEDFVLSEKFSEMVDEIILREFDNQVVEAVRALLASKVRRQIFQPSSPNPNEAAAS